MNNPVVTKIQLVQPGNVGYLDVAEDIPFPMNYSIADIRDISKRTGSFSKTVTLPGTKNNHQVLNYYFDINVLDGTFSVNKMQECIVLKNNIPVTKNAFLQLIAVNKIQTVQTEDDQVTYEVVIKENIGEFFTRISQKELTDLDFSNLDGGLLFNSQTIINSFSNTVTDGYKFLMPWTNAPLYVIQDFKPAIYAKQYWDRIHADAGFSYDWSTLSDNNVKFDKLIIPYNADEKKTSEDLKESTKVIVDRAGFPTKVQQKNAVGPIGLGSVFVIQGNSSSGQIVNFGQYRQRLDVLNEIYDPFNYWRPSIPPPPPNPQDSDGYYVSPVATGNNSHINFKFVIDYNIETVRVGFPISLVTPVVGQVPTIIPRLEVRNFNTSSSFDVPLQGFAAPNQTGLQISGTQTQLTVNNYEVNLSVNNVNVGNYLMLYSILEFPYEIQGVGAYSVRLNITSCQVTVTVNSDNMLYNQPILFNNFIPIKIKQSEFLKSIYQMYNLYIETDPTDSTKLIYKHRDDFYDSGAIKDWTHKLARDQEQDLKFLPELTFNRRLILTYKEDDDPANQAYIQGVKQIYGQQEVIFQNEYVRETSTKTLLFSPTPSQRTNFQAVLPYIDGKSPSNNIRILIDNGSRSCGPFTIVDYALNFQQAFQTVSTYPFICHYDDPINPNFDINYGVCQYYFYNINYPTNNNLYNNFWRRTMAQIDSSRVLIAFFWLDEFDIQNLKLNDKIRIDNSYWNINKIIDFNASANVLTKVELISIDPDLDFPDYGSFGKNSKVLESWQTVPIKLPVLSDGTMAGVERVNQKFIKNSIEISNIINTTKNTELLGRNNLITSDFSGVVNADQTLVRSSGFVIGSTTYTETGEISRFGRIIDGGVDIVYDRNNMSRVTLIDGTNDYLGVTGGAILPINDDYNWGNPIRNGGNIDTQQFPL